MKTYEHIGPSAKNMRLYRLFALLTDIVLCLGVGIAAHIIFWLCRGFEMDEIVKSFWGLLRDASGIYLALFFFKDMFGRSIGKIIFGLYIVERDSDEKAAFSKRFFRNFSLMLLPIEGIALLISETNTRLADKLLEIQVVKKAK